MDVQYADNVLSDVLSQNSVLIGEYISENMANTKCNISYVDSALRIEGETNTDTRYQPYWLQNGLPDVLELVEGKDNVYRFAFNIAEGKVCEEPYYYKERYNVKDTIITTYSYEKNGTTYFLHISFNISEKELSIAIMDDIENKTGHAFSLFH